MPNLKFVVTVAFLSLSVSAHAEDRDEAALNKAYREVDRIVDAELAKQFSPEGFKVGPLQIDYQKSPAYQKLETGSLWKRADERKGERYAAMQREVNDRISPKAKAFRGDLLDAFESAAELSGGGSASGFFLNLAAAETEWIIANLNREEKQITSDAAVKERLRSLATGIIPDEFIPQKIGRVIAKLHKAETHLSKGQANVVRKEFLAYFSQGRTEGIKTGGAYTPKQGTKERTAILDPVRHILEKKIHQKVIFVIEHMKVENDWAFFKAIPKTKDGGPINYKGTEFEEDAETADELTVALLRKKQGKWTVVAHDYFTTDVWWERLWEAHKPCPKSIFSE